MSNDLTMGTVTDFLTGGVPRVTIDGAATPTKVYADVVVVAGDRVVLAKVRSELYVIAVRKQAKLVWTPITLASGFTSSDLGQGGDGPAVAALIGGRVSVQGVVRGTLPNATATIIGNAGALPAGLRPYHKVNEVAYFSSGPGRLIITADGTITATASGGAATYVDLSGVAPFPAEL